MTDEREAGGAEGGKARKEQDGCTEWGIVLRVCRAGCSRQVQN
jgi:hypothetical protein